MLNYLVHNIFIFILLYCKADCIVMQSNPLFKFTQVALYPQTVIQQFSMNSSIDYLKPNHTYTGTLEILIQVKSGVLIMKMEQQISSESQVKQCQFLYGVNPNDQVIYDNVCNSEKQCQLAMLCLDTQNKKQWIIKISQNIELIYFLMSERCKFINRRAANVIVTQSQSEVCAVQNNRNSTEIVVGATSTEHAKEIQKKQEEQKQQPTGQLLIQASKTLGKGLTLAGKIVSKGLSALGSFIAKRVQPAQAIQVSEETKKIVAQSASVSKKILEITSEQFAMIFRMAVQQAVKVANKFQNSQRGQEMKKNSKYDFQGIKNNVKTGLHVVFNLYGGFTEGVGEAGKGLAKGTTEVVGAKYGQDAGEVSYNLGKGALNVYHITKIPGVQAKRALKPDKN